MLPLWYSYATIMYSRLQIRKWLCKMHGINDHSKNFTVSWTYQRSKLLINLKCNSNLEIYKITKWIGRTRTTSLTSRGTLIHKGNKTGLGCGWLKKTGWLTRFLFCTIYIEVGHVSQFTWNYRFTKNGVNNNNYREIRNVIMVDEVKINFLTFFQVRTKLIGCLGIVKAVNVLK